MTHAPTNLLSATTALIAVLALGSTPAGAQEAAASPIELPAQPQPTLELPTEAPAPPPPAAPLVVSQPIIQQAPQAPLPAETTSVVEEAAPVAQAAERRPTSRAASTPRTQSPVALVAPVPAVGVASSATPEPPPSAAAVPQAVSAVTPPPPVTAPQERAGGLGDSDGSLAAVGAVAALLLALGIGGGYAVTRARRRRVEDHSEGREAAPAMVTAAKVPTNRLEPELLLPAYATVEEVGAEPIVRAVEPTPHPSVAQCIGSEDLATVPRSRAERDAMLERMVSAPPSAENPFTSRKGRLRRARIILQSLEQRQKDEATQPFDWRTYKPSTSSPTPATPPRVTA